MVIGLVDDILPSSSDIQTASPVPPAPAWQGAAKIKEPVLSALLSFLLSGLGQIYNGQVKKGLAFLVLDFLLAFVLVCILFGGSVVMALLTFWAGGLGMCCCFPFFFLPFVWKIYFMYDAYMVAGQINRGEIVKDWFS